MSQQNGSIGKNIAAGIVGGLAGSLAMNQFQSLLSKIEPQGGGQSGSGEPATVKAAEAVSEEILDRRIPDDKKETAGNIAHYAMGAASGGLYGALSALDPTVSLGSGVLFGALLWLVADELAVPAFRLSDAPTASPAPVHIKALASHVVYGLTTDLTRRGLKKLL